ncbi:MAG: outer membrane beta-barrel protein [Pseudomonadota bacterium]
MAVHIRILRQVETHRHLRAGALRAILTGSALSLSLAPAAAQPAGSDTTISNPLPTITEPQPESRTVITDPIVGTPENPFPQAPGTSRRTGNGSTGIFTGPIDPDTQDSPSVGARPAGDGSLRGIFRGTVTPDPGSGAGTRQDIRRVTSDGRLVRPGDPGFETAQPGPNEPEQLNVPDAALDGDFDTDIDPDLRETFDDDLQITDEVRTGPLLGAQALDDRLGTLPAVGQNPFDQTRDDFEAFEERPYDPLGVRAGSFVLRPSITATTIITDNAFQSPGPKEADIGAEVRPALRIESDWNRHAVSLDANATAVFWNEFDTENTVDASVVARARLDVTLRTNFEADLGYRIVTQERGSIDSVTGAISEPETKTFEAGLTANHRVNRLVTRTRLGYTDERNGDAELIGGGVDLGSDEDFSRVEIASRWSYEMSPSFAAFVEGSYNWQTFDQALDADGLLRDSQGYEMRAGFNAEIGPAIRAEVSAGYAVQQAEDARLADVSGVVFGADVTWRPTALTTLGLTAASEIDTSSVAGSLGAINRAVAVNVRHEFRRYAIGTLGVAWAQEDFEGAQVTEDELRFQLGAEYLFSRNLVALANYEHVRFSSTRPDSDYDENIFRLGLQVRR